MRFSVPIIALSLVAAACGSDSATNPDAVDEAEAPTEIDAPAETDIDTDTPAEAESADTIDADVTIEPGALAVGSVKIDGTTVQYVTITPAGFEPGDTAPVVFAFPPGGQDIGLARSFAEGTYLTEALERGWVVVSPAAPDGVLFFSGSEALVPGLLDWINTWVSPEGGKPHVIGVSNGGRSTFRAAAQNPDRFRSLLVFPGFPGSDADKAALEDLTDVPIRMFAGENDTAWVEPMQETLATLTDLGADATLEVVPGEGHIIGALSDGVRIFDELDASR